MPGGTEKSAKFHVVDAPVVGVFGAAPQLVDVVKPSVLYRTSNWLGALLLASRTKLSEATFNWAFALAVTENSM